MSATEPKIVAAIRLIEDHADKQLCVADLALCTGMSVRWLQQRFRVEVGVSPAKYIRLVRLRRIREDLLAADPADGCTVEAVVARWGINHQGRFAALYRCYYNEFPSETLYRR